MNIQAIETTYHGYRFRSRLEARWAVYLDAIGIAWEYEPEGFDLGNGLWYLPDFYMPAFGLFAEIKHGSDPLESVDVFHGFFKATRMAALGKNIVWLQGPPSVATYRVLVYAPSVDSGYRSAWALMLPFHLERMKRLGWNDAEPQPQLSDEFMSASGDALAGAVSAARAARFDRAASAARGV